MEGVAFVGSVMEHRAPTSVAKRHRRVDIRARPTGSPVETETAYDRDLATVANIPRSTVTSTLLFDLDDTLIADTLDATAAVVATCAAHAIDGVDPAEVAATVISRARASWPTDACGGVLAEELGISAIEALYADFDTCHERPARLRAVAEAYQLATWTEAFAIHGWVPTTDEVDVVAKTFRHLRTRSITVYPDVREVLDALAPSHRMGIITNGPADLQRDKLDASGLAGYFEVVVISGALGRGKPSAAPFEAAMAALGADPATTTMVGDNPARDMKGAEAAGIASVCITRPHGLVCDLSRYDPISDLRALLPLAV